MAIFSGSGSSQIEWLRLHNTAYDGHYVVCGRHNVFMAGTLETQLRAMMDAVDELNQESIKFNKHQNMVLKQYQEKTR